MKLTTRIIALGCIILLGSTPTFAQKKIKDIKYPKLNTVEIPSPTSVTLDNGMQIHLLEDHSLPLVNIRARLNCGSYLEPAEKVGLAAIAGDMLRTGGTENMTSDEIDARLEAIGASVESSIGTTSGSVSANALSEYSETIIEIMSDVLRRPVFDPDKIELAKTGSRSNISRRNDNPRSINTREFRKLLYGADSPYARHTEYATIESISREDLIEFHEAYIQPQGTQLSVWGDFKTDEMVALLTRHFGDWARGTTEIPPPPDVEYEYKSTINYAEKTDVNQSNIFLGHIGGKMGDPDYPATIVMNSILGGGFTSRLFGQVRTTEGLAYAVAGTYSFNFANPGMFYVFVSTKSGTTVQALESCMREIRRMQTDAPTDEELQRAKDGYLNSFVFNFDTKSEILTRMMTYNHYGFDSDYLQQTKEAVEKVTAEDVLDVAKRKLHPDNLQIMVTGNSADFDRPLSDLGRVNVIDITIPSPSEDEFMATDEELAMGMEMLAKATEACGGLSTFKKAQTIQRTAKLTIQTPGGAMALDMVVVSVIAKMTHQTLTFPMGTQVSVYNGQEGWTTMGGQTKMMATAEVEDMVRSQERHLIFLMQSSDEPTFKVAYRGTEELGARESIRLDFLTATGNQFKLYLDPETFRPSGMRYMAETQAGPAEIVETILTFTDAGGMKLPAKLHREGGPMTFDIEYTKTVVNASINEVDFQKPDTL